MFKGVIFDVDGTITHTNRLIFSTFNFISNKYLNRSYTDNELISLFGPTEDVILKDWCKDRYDSAREDYYRFYEDKHDELAGIYNGIPEIIRYIKSKNIPLGIYTGKGKDATIITLKKVNVLQYFDYIATGDDVKEHKPSPEGILNFAGLFNLNPNDILMIGDSHIDIKAARSAGAKVASVLWDSLSTQKVLALGSDYIFYSVEELNKFIMESI